MPEPDDKPDAAVQFFGIIGKLLFKITIFLALGLYTAYVVQRYWEWFVLPVFGGPQPRIIPLWGLYIITKFVARWPIKTREDTAEEKALEFSGAEVTWRSIVSTSVMWGLGYCLHLMDQAWGGWLV